LNILLLFKEPVYPELVH